jgi:hypothetical protein
MEQVCHRCGTVLNGSDPFCPHCGAPQLRYEVAEETAPSPSTSPALRFVTRNADTIAWRDAILAAALIAFPAGMLSSLLGGLEVLWALAGGIALVSLYRRRTGALPTSRVGWRIGAVLGLFAAVIASTVNGIGLLVQRYALRQGAMLDQQFRDAAETVTKMYVNQFAASNPDVAAALTGALHFWVTPDGAAAMMLGQAAWLTITMLLFAGAGGALGARLTQRSAQPSAR